MKTKSPFKLKLKQKNSLLTLLTIIIFFLVVIFGADNLTFDGQKHELVLNLSPAESSPSADNQLTEFAVVDRVVDGDTIVLSDGRRVRYIGIDTPELARKGQEAEYYAEQATKRNQALVAQQKVRLEKDISETDRYGRLLRYVYLDEMMINLILVQEGYARVATYPPDVKYQDLFLQAEREARQERRGLWQESGAD